MIAVTARIQGRGLGAAIGDVTHALAEPGVLAPGARYELGTPSGTDPIAGERGATVS